MIFGKIFRFGMLIMGIASIAMAQPANDNCANAELLNVGYNTGIFTTTTIDITAATIQLGEPFHSAQISAGNDKKSIWFKFYLPTARAINIELKQPGTAIAEDGAGFTVFYLPNNYNCFPALADIGPAKLTPINKFGSSYNPCLLPGYYMVQVSAKLASNGPVFLELTSGSPGVLNDYDFPSTADYFNVISGGWYNHNFDVGCQTIEDASENCPALGANFAEYTQSTWHVFRTDQFIDALRLEIGEQTFTGNLKVGINIYEGDVRSTPIGSLILVDGCNFLQQSNASYYAGKTLLCQLDPNKYYSIQIFYHKFYSNTINLRLYELGSGITKSPDPSAIHTSSQLGVLPASAGGTWTYGQDTLSCNAFIADYPCGSVNPISGIVTSGGYNYRLNTWYTFTLAQAANVRFVTNGNLLKRLYPGDVGADCNLPSIWDFTSGDVTYPCLPAGTYSVQLLGKLDTTLSYFTHGFYNNIGQQANLSLQVTSVNIPNGFMLDASGHIDSVNFVGGIWQPLPTGAVVNSHLATFGCQVSVLPASGSCAVINKKAIYREVVIDQDGILTVGGPNYPYFQYVLYQGDASALATAQGAYSYGQTISGLTPMFACDYLYYPQHVCVTPGIYTLVTFADSTDVGRSDQPWFRFDVINTLFDDPAAPNNMGDVTAGVLVGTISGTPDYWSCIDNPLTIDGQAPCSGTSKQIYREFYLSQPVILNITQSNSNYFRLFYGRVSDGIGTLSANIPGYGNLGCRGSFYADICKPLVPGWYTIVQYGSGGVYAGPTFNGSLLGAATNISLSHTNPPLPPNFNRPFKAYNAGITDWGPNAGSSAYPNNGRTYTFGTERLNCIADTPFTTHPINVCPTGFNRVGYFVFNVTKESFISITGIPNSMISRIYALDVRTDSLLFPTATPIQECIARTDIGSYERSWWTWIGKIEVCRLQPGTYTLVVFANNTHINSSYTPVLYVDNTDVSRFDFAAKAYDFGEIPADNTTYLGKVGDTNPIDPGRAASNDLIYCTTGAFSTDVGQADINTYCWDGLFPQGPPESIDYPIAPNEPVYTGATTNLPVRRNLWYTFVVDGPGKVYVSVFNKTPGKLTPQMPFSIYLSDEDGNIAYPALVAGGQVDSTLAQGLTYIENSSYMDWYGCAGNYQTIDFSISPCDPLIKRRFYVVVDQHAGLVVNDQVEVGIRFEPVAPTPLRYDHYSHANVINGLGETDPPYTPVNLIGGNYDGASGSFACATKDITDQNTCGTRTLWYKFTSAISGKIRLNYTIQGMGTFFNASNVMLFRETVPGDSTSIGLVNKPMTAISVAGTPWGEACLNPGTYYIMLTGCSYTIENVIPHIWLLDEFGDLCTNPVPLVLNSPGTSSNTVAVDCHSIGEAFGEDGSNMGCLFGPAGYKSTWFRVDLNMSPNVDLSFQLAENTTALPHQIRYRVLYGSCTAMTAGPCNTDALTEFTLNCMLSTNTSYFVQVVEPLNATGTLTLTVRADSAPNQSCEPFDPLIPTANFTVNNGCAGDSICFVNQSTQGDSIWYFWDFGVGTLSNDTSRRENPCYLYPVPPSGVSQTYNVTLIAYNTEFNTSDTVIIPVTVYPIPAAIITRVIPLDGDSIIAGNCPDFASNATDTLLSSPWTSYLWDFGNGSTSALANPISICFDYPDLGLNIVYLYVINGTCTLMVTDTFYVVSESIFGGGPRDGASANLQNNCTAENIWSGGDYDGSDMRLSAGLCPPEAIWYGGPYDGSDFNLSSGLCPPEMVWQGGNYDGNAAGEGLAYCPPELIWQGGYYDGGDVNLNAAECPPEIIWQGGFFDGSGFHLFASVCSSESIWRGGFYDGSSNSAGTCSLLPVEMLYIAAFWDKANGIVQWATASEINNDGFYIERSTDGGNFEVIGFVDGQGNSNALNTYFFSDEDLAYRSGEIFYYRLRQTDFNGSIEYSDIVSLRKENMDGSNSDPLQILYVYPNPALPIDILHILLQTEEAGQIELDVTNEMGQLIMSKKQISIGGIVYIELDLQNQAPGTYSLQIRNQYMQKTTKFVIIE